MSSRGLSFFPSRRPRPYEKLPPDREPPDWPKYLLLYDAIELALKAYLIQCGVSEKDLKDEYGQPFLKPVARAALSGALRPSE
jgi:hypothetical protein